MSQAALALPGKRSPERVDPFSWRDHNRHPVRGAPARPRVGRRRMTLAMAALTIAAGMLALGAHADRFAPIVRPVVASLRLPWIAPEVRVEKVSGRLIDDGRTLLVEGTIVNASGRDLKSPTLRLAIRAADRSEIFVWTARPAEAHLAPEGRTRFSSRLAAPPTGGVEVAVALQTAGE